MSCSVYAICRLQDLYGCAVVQRSPIDNSIGTSDRDPFSKYRVVALKDLPNASAVPIEAGASRAAKELEEAKARQSEVNEYFYI